MMKGLTAVCALCVCMAAGTPVLAATHTYSVEVENNVTVGDVNISLDEYELDENGNEIPYKNGKKVVPGEVVHKIVRINNEAQDAWIRAKVEYNSDDGLTGMDDGMLGELPDLWIKRGDYFYYTVPLETDEAVDFFKTVTIPYEWNENDAQRGFSIGVTAQAIQSRNFQPDFQAEEPWFGVPIEKCIHDSQDIYQVEGEQEFSVIFENGAEGFVKTGEDFFDNFSALLPGDKVTDSVEIGNHFYRNIDIYFRTEIPEEQSEAALELLEKLELTIKNGEDVIYQGPLNAESLQEEIQLADNLQKDETKTLSYTIYMPKELQNAFALREAKVRWIFRAEYRISSGGSNGGYSGDEDPDHGPGTETIESNPEPEPEQSEIPLPPVIKDIVEYFLPKTGDYSYLYLYAAVGSAGMLAVLLLIRKNKEDSGKEENQHE